MGAQRLFEQIRTKESFLCVGLDTDLRRIPISLQTRKDPIFEFNRAIIDATADLAVAYKPNLAFYEAYGSRGWESLQRTTEYVKTAYPDIMLIADAKRGDISNTASMYARSLFHAMKFDAVTLSPYMGRDTVTPFLEYEGKWVILLALTSNSSFDDFETTPCENGQMLFEQILRKSCQWGHDGNMMYVVGASRVELLQKVRAIVPHHFLLVPGVGYQGGDLDEVVEHGMTRKCGLLINSSRGIIYADNSSHFAEAARKKALTLQRRMAEHLEAKGII